MFIPGASNISTPYSNTSLPYACPVLKIKSLSQLEANSVPTGKAVHSYFCPPSLPSSSNLPDRHLPLHRESPALEFLIVFPAAAGTGLFVLLAKLPESGTIRLIFAPNEFAMPGGIFNPAPTTKLAFSSRLYSFDHVKEWDLYLTVVTCFQH